MQSGRKQNHVLFCFKCISLAINFIEQEMVISPHHVSVIYNSSSTHIVRKHPSKQPPDNDKGHFTQVMEDVTEEKALRNVLEIIKEV